MNEQHNTELRRLRQEVRALKSLVLQMKQLLEEQRPTNNLITVAEFAKRANCSRSTVICRIKSGVYAAQRHGKLWYLPVSELASPASSTRDV